MSLRKKTLLLMAAVAVIVAGIGGTISYFTSGDSGSNIFALGKVKLELTEEKWDPDAEHLILKGAAFDKDPAVTNTGSVDAYVRIKVKVNEVSVMKDAGVEVPSVLFTGEGTGYNQDGKWTQEETSAEDADADTVTYTFVYKDPLAPGQSTGPLFQKVIFPENLDEGLIKTEIGTGEFVISVSADGVQSKTFDNATEAFEAFDKM